MTNAKVLRDIAVPRGKYPHIRRAGDFYYISGTSARQADDTIEGAELSEAGGLVLDIRAQTRAIIKTLGIILQSVGCDLDDLVAINTFLVSMEDFPAYNEVYAEHFSFEGPTRTTVAVRELPHPHLLIEMQAVAYKSVESF